jgi:hypothetical protein
MPTAAINVNAPLGSPNGDVAMSTGTLNVNAQVTALNNITLTADNMNIGAPLVATASTVTLQPLSSGRPISIGTETPGALSLTAAELAMVAPSVDQLIIGSTTSGPMTISGPIASSSLDLLSLLAGGSITQSPDAPILLQKTTISQGTAVPVGSLQAISSSGTVDLRAPGNQIPDIISGNAGSARDFQFVNSLPMKLQDIQASGVGGGRVLVNSGLFGPLPALFFLGGGDESLLNELLAAIDRIFEDPFGRKEEEKQKEDTPECK